MIRPAHPGSSCVPAIDVCRDFCPRSRSATANFSKIQTVSLIPRRLLFAIALPALILVFTPSLASVIAQEKNGTRDLTFDDFKFEMKKGERFKDNMLTEEIKSLDGKTVRVRGFIRPSLKQKGISKFVFVRDNQECCFGPGAMLYDCVLVHMAKDNELEFTVRPITLEGTFFIKKFMGPDKKVWAVFRMKDVRKR